jgi:hypothetical protein
MVWTFYTMLNWLTEKLVGYGGGLLGLVQGVRGLS